MSIDLRTARRALAVAVIGAFMSGIGGALAGEILTGDQITQLLSGKTVTGAMESGGDYAEFYQADGTIKGKDYTGSWSVEGDSMCFQYGSDPKDCWQVGADGDNVEWIKDGMVEGTGLIVDGNPNNF
jgi:hypothetical protein